jgi:single-stranded-DNA-specific exonuclease
MNNIVDQESEKKFLWRLKENFPYEKVNDLNDFLNSLIQKRKIDNVNDFLQKSVQKYWPKLYEIPDLDKAIMIIMNALQNNQKVGIVGDYDVDGGSATSLLKLFFEEVKLNFIYRIPNRFKDGYGISIGILKEFLKEKVDIVITVDNGTTAYEAIEFIKQHSMKMIILDHHAIQKEISVDAFVNPHSNLCATGIVFVFLAELNKRLGKVVNMDQYVDLVTLATICDVMPLIGFNRVMVNYGLKKIEKNPMPFMAALLGKDMKNIDTQRLGFNVGPYINAPGRFGFGELAVEFLTSRTLEEAKKLSLTLAIMNTERRNVEKKILNEAMSIMEESESVIIVYGKEWHEGVLGIVAGRLKDRFNKPVLVLTEFEENMKGSCRSVTGFHVGKMIKEAVDRNILKHGGGHEMAGGFSLKKDQIENFKTFVKEFTSKNQIVQSNIKYVDLICSINIVQKTIFDQTSILAPFGPSNSDPLFFFPNCIVQKVVMINSRDCIISLISSNYQTTASAILFDVNNGLFSKLTQEGKAFHIIGYIKRNQIHVYDYIAI